MTFARPLVIPTLALAAAMLPGCTEQAPPVTSDPARQESVASTPTPPKAIDAGVSDTAKDAWIYAYPMLMNYQTLYTQAVDSRSSAYVGGFNQFRHYSTYFTPKNHDIVTPNNDTPYSWAWLDLRAEPMVLSVPATPKDRYNVFQFFDLFTYNFAYVGVRATGYAAGNYLFTGPGWQGETPAGITKVFPSETSVVGILGRTSLKGPNDIPTLKALQAQYKLAPLSQFLGTPAPAAAATVDWPKWDKDKALGVDFIGYLNVLLQFTQPPNPADADKLARFAAIGIGPGRPFDAAALDPTLRQAIEAGVAEGGKTLAEKVKQTHTSQGLFGSRDALGPDSDLKRAVAANMGIYGNSAEEAIYQGWHADGDGHPLVGSKQYEITFPAGQTPPVTLFWSATMYDLPDRLLVENPINRYSLGSDSAQLKYNRDGSLTIHVQKDSPGKGKETNWLPAPEGAFTVITRLYGPKPEAVDGSWKQPEMRQVNAKAPAQ